MAPVTMPPEIEKALIASKKQIEEAEHELARAEKVGLDVGMQKEVVARARKMRDDLLAEYGRNAVRTK